MSQLGSLKLPALRFRNHPHSRIASVHQITCVRQQHSGGPPSDAPTFSPLSAALSTPLPSFCLIESIKHRWVLNPTIHAKYILFGLPCRPSSSRRLTDSPSGRLIQAQWVALQRVSSMRKCARPRSAANVAYFAESAFARKVIGEME